jgi:hypothetical protein
LNCTVRRRVLRDIKVQLAEAEQSRVALTTGVCQAIEPQRTAPRFVI